MGRLSTYAPTVIVPTVMSALCHQLFITHPLLLGQIPACEMCLTTRSGLMQMALGAVYPMLISPLACIALARKYNTYAVPPATQPRQVLGMMRNVFPTQGRFLILCAVNFFVGMYLADKERTCARNTILKETTTTEGFSKEGFQWCWCCCPWYNYVVSRSGHASVLHYWWIQWNGDWLLILLCLMLLGSLNRKLEREILGQTVSKD